MVENSFIEGVSCSVAAVLPTEIIAHANDLKISLPITFMDVSKAFRLVYHKCLLNIIHAMGVRGTLWDLHYINGDAWRAAWPVSLRASNSAAEGDIAPEG